jgi:hypothetical protein
MIVFYFIPIFFYTFVPNFGDARSVFFGTALKRESGANPEQTRYCKFHQKSLNKVQSTVLFEIL